MTEKLCQRRRGSIAPHPCGLKATERIDGKDYCGRCAGIERRVRANRARKRQDEETLKQRGIELAKRMRRAESRLDLEKGTTDLVTFGLGFYTGEVRLKLESFEELAETYNAK